MRETELASCLTQMQSVSWNRNALLRFRFRLWKSFSFGSGSRQCLIYTVLYNILPFQCQNQHYFPGSWPLIDFFCIPFYVGSGSKSGSGTVFLTGTLMHSGSGSGSAKAKSHGSCRSGSGSTASNTIQYNTNYLFSLQSDTHIKDF
jgi:hypothetical protein